MKSSWKYLLGILLLLGLLAVVSANPLVVTYQERYNITAYVSGDGKTSSTIHNLTGYIVINNTASEDILSDVWVAVYISNNISEPRAIYNNTSAPKGVNITRLNPYHTRLPRGLTYIHIPVLSSKSYVTIAIPLNTSMSKVGVPIIVNESYSTTKVPACKLVKWNVTFNISRNVSALPDENTPVSVNVTKYLSNDPNHYGSPYWNYLNIKNPNSNQGNTALWDGPYFSGETDDTLNWTNVVLNSSQNASLTFTVEANSSYSGRNATEVPYGFAVIFFKYNGTISGTKIEGVYAVGDSVISVYKKGPEMNTTTGKYNIWYENTSFKNNASEYYYNITSFRIWAVNGSNLSKLMELGPFHNSLIIPGSDHFEEIYEIIGPGEFWNSPTYNFTFDGVPVIWANYFFKIADSNITLQNISINEYNDQYGSSYIVIEKIYLVGSYLIKVTKVIKTNEDGTYTIYIVVENIGGEKSPFVYVYDLVPKNFIVKNITVNRPWMENTSGNQTLTNNDRYYLSLYWCLNPLNGGADGDGWYNDTELENNQTVLITYTLEGNGTFIPSDLFVVGIDPTHSLLPTTSPKMIMIGGSSGNNYEILLALMTGVVGMAFVVRKIKR